MYVAKAKTIHSEQHIFTESCFSADFKKPQLKGRHKKWDITYGFEDEQMKLMTKFKE